MANQSDPAECCIQVFCRVRPLNDIERKNSSTFVPKFTGKDTIAVGGKTYTYDQVFDPNCNQEQVYKGAAHHIVQDVLNGFNGTIFAYGQTSSGKTHTMEGNMEEGNSPNHGVIPRIINDIFSHIYGLEDPNLEFNLKTSYFEIYNEKIRDLLDISKTNLTIHEGKDKIPFVKDVTEANVSCFEEVMYLIKEGQNNRQKAVTNMNEHSSRSHSVFQIQVSQENKQTQKKLTGKLYLVDLAGSEKVSKTGAEGSVLEEAKNINKSLSSLGNVISALADGTKGHIPYRDSKLTRILQESLGGNSRTTIIICCSPASFNESETKSTLLFGARAKTIKNVVVVNEELTAAEWKRRYENEREKNSQLREKLKSLLGVDAELKRWRAGEKVPESQWSNINDLETAAQTIMTPSMSESILLPSPHATALTHEKLPEGPMTDAERRRYEEQLQVLYQQLDERDEEIQLHANTAEQLKQQLTEQENLIHDRKNEYERALGELQQAQQENTKAHEEAEELFNALQELALNLDQKKNEVTDLRKENDTLQDEIGQNKEEAIKVNGKLDELKERELTQKKRVYECLQSIVNELAALGNYSVPPKFSGDSDKSFVEEDILAHVRIFVSKVASDSAQKLSQNESGSEAAKQLEVAEQEVQKLRVQVQQNETARNNHETEITDLKTKVQKLEDEVTALNLKLAGSNAGGASSQAVEELRQMVQKKNDEIKSIQGKLQTLQTEKDQLQQEYEKLKNDELLKEKRLKDLSADKTEQTKKDLKGLEETVEKELNSLHSLRRMFLQDLSQKLKKAPVSADGEDEFLSSPAQKQKIAFLQNNLDQLTRVHKQLVRDNAELRSELPKLEKRLRASMERVKNLETALRETKENAMRDRKKYQMEVERIKEAVRQRSLRRGFNAQIAKPIRPGQQYQPNTPGRPPMAPFQE
ncbi:Kinesin-like protein [Aphelenchoides bicaudatus]|nr:Kinesin-like protein [Aphelenchoides bicaudatus]